MKLIKTPAPAAISAGHPNFAAPIARRRWLSAFDSTASAK
jgi:hypothetical protein